MIRETALYVMLLFVVPIYLMAAGPVVEDVGGEIQQNNSVQELSLGGNITTLKTVMMVGVPLLWIAGWSLWYFLFGLRQDRFVGTGGGRVR